ncbi:TLC domain-containing protein [Obelidium mucronatum]|nr:TLC domain-containing protein [Obelidium mucronatum]
MLESLGVPLLANHWKVVLGSAISWHLLFLLGRWASERYIKQYKTWDRMRKMDWGIRFSSFLNAIIVCSLSYPILIDPKMYNNKLWGYTQYAGDVNAIILGYFIWDIYVSLQMGDPGFIVHGLSAFLVYFLCFKPFIMYYGAVFIMYELSTPFLNIHWMCDKLGRTGSMVQLVNGIILLIVFFVARIVVGLYFSVELYVAMYNEFEKIPLHLVIAYSSLNLVLNALNIFWFYKMVDSVRRRFAPGGKTQQYGESGNSGFSSSKKGVKKRE